MCRKPPALRHERGLDAGHPGQARRPPIAGGLGTAPGCRRLAESLPESARERGLRFVRRPSRRCGSAYRANRGASAPRLAGADREIVHGRDADSAREPVSQGRARHARLPRKLLDAPGMAGHRRAWSASAREIRPGRAAQQASLFALSGMFWICARTGFDEQQLRPSLASTAAEPCRPAAASCVAYWNEERTQSAAGESWTRTTMIDRQGRRDRSWRSVDRNRR